MSSHAIAQKLLSLPDAPLVDVGFVLTKLDVVEECKAEPQYINGVVECYKYVEDGKASEDAVTVICIQ